MRIERSIRSMTPQEKQAKREWGTGACQAKGCTTRAAYLVHETPQDDAGQEEWWQYCCPKHARGYAAQHGLDMPEPIARPAHKPEARFAAV